MMSVPREIVRSLYLILLTVTVVASAQAQQPGTAASKDIARALELYRSGDLRAIDRLSEITRRRPNDAEAWDALATVLQREGMFGRARAALERLTLLRPNAGDVRAQLAYALILSDREQQRAISEAERALELGDQSAEAHYAIAEGNFRSGTFPKALTEADVALSIKPDFTPALITKSMVHTALKQYPEAAASLERVLAIDPNDIDADTWRGQIEELALRAAEGPSSQSVAGSLVYTGKEVTQKARVTSKPEPQYTEPARKAGVSGTIVLRAVFSAEGDVKRVFIARALGYGLTSQAVKAARLIKFIPAMKDGQPVSTFIQLEYNFNLY